jgi:hypothetical protein
MLQNIIVILTIVVCALFFIRQIFADLTAKPTISSCQGGCSHCGAAGKGAGCAEPGRDCAELQKK